MIFIFVLESQKKYGLSILSLFFWFRTRSCCRPGCMHRGLEGERGKNPADSLDVSAYSHSFCTRHRPAFASTASFVGFRALAGKDQIATPTRSITTLHITLINYLLFSFCTLEPSKAPCPVYDFDTLSRSSGYKANHILKNYYTLMYVYV